MARPPRAEGRGRRRWRRDRRGRHRSLDGSRGRDRGRDPFGRTTIVLVGLGAPKQERWIERHADTFPSVRILIGVGGAFDMWAGSKRRAPARSERSGSNGCGGLRSSPDGSPDPARDRRLPDSRDVRSGRLSAGPVPDTASARRAAQRRDDQVGGGPVVPGGPARGRGRLLSRSGRTALEAGGRRRLDPRGAGPIGSPPPVELRRRRAAQHRTQPELDDGRARRGAPRARRSRRSLRGRLAHGPVRARGVRRHPAAPRAQRRARHVAPARRARDQPGPQARGPAGGPQGPAVRGGSARTVRRGVRGLRTRPGHPGRPRPHRPRDRPASERRRPCPARAPRAHAGTEPVLLFLATLSWPPNAEGLSRFLGDDFPALLERVPEARLVVAGSGRRSASSARSTRAAAPSSRAPSTTTRSSTRERGASSTSASAGRARR